MGLLHVGPPGGAPALRIPPDTAVRFERLEREGDALEEIVTPADSLRADLVAMTTAGQRGFLDALRGSSNERVLRRVAARCSRSPKRAHGRVQSPSVHTRAGFASFLRVVPPPDAESRAQREYYALRAGHYDDAHLQANDEHQLALAFMVGAIEFLDVRSVLDVGSGTGRVLTYLKTHTPAVARVGIEPVGELRRVAYGKGVSEAELRDGDATQLAFPDGSFDLVSEFGMLHHVRDHARVVREMLRVASKAIFVSDSNNFGQGSRWMRAAKQALHTAGLWRAADLIKTRGKGYSITEGDGLAYSYSVFDDYQLIRANCRSVHVLNTKHAGVNPYRSASHVALLGIK